MGCCEASEQESQKTNTSVSQRGLQPQEGLKLWSLAEVDINPEHSRCTFLRLAPFTTKIHNLDMKATDSSAQWILSSQDAKSGTAHITWVLKNMLLWIMQSSHSQFKLDSVCKSDIQDFTLWCYRDKRATSPDGWRYCFNLSIWTCSSNYQVWKPLTLKPRQWRAQVRNNTWTTCNHLLMLMYQWDCGRTQWLSLTELFTKNAVANLGKDG